MLGKIAKGSAFGKNDFAGIGGKFSYDNFEQRRFAGTVDADNRCFFILIDMKGNPIQDFLFTKMLCDVVTCKYHKNSISF